MQGKKVKLFTGIIVRNNPELIKMVKDALEKTFSEIILESRIIPFNYTNYYQKEMGKELLRFWAGYKKPILPDELPDIKKKAVELEKGFCDEKGNRQVNIDPGYLELSKIVLSSTKDYSHRIYLRDGVYAELEYQFLKGKYEPVSWTYPDYRDTPAIEFFHNLRRIFKEELKNNP
ncbi:MAG: DUF4416 family protein [bacterium]